MEFSFYLHSLNFLQRSTRARKWIHPTFVKVSVLSLLEQHIKFSFSTIHELRLTKIFGDVGETCFSSARIFSNSHFPSLTPASLMVITSHRYTHSQRLKTGYLRTISPSSFDIRYFGDYWGIRCWYVVYERVCVCLFKAWG